MNGLKRHIIEDDDLLLDWSVGALSQEKHEAIMDHLADCSSCRREIAKMVQAKALILPEVYDPGLKWRRFAAIASLLAIAAVLMIAVLLPGSGGGETDAARMLAMVQKDLAAGQFENVIDRTAKLLDVKDSLSTSERARLVNLQIQAKRGETNERSLAGRTSLVRDYGYERDGIRRIKDPVFPQITPTIKRISNELENAVDEYPDSLDLRLNLGQFLLEQREFSEAEKQFEEALRIDPSSGLAETGLGIALIQQKDPEKIQKALGHFRRAVELEPDNADAAENLAACLARLDEK